MLSLYPNGDVRGNRNYLSFALKIADDPCTVADIGETLLGVTVFQDDKNTLSDGMLLHLFSKLQTLILLGSRITLAILICCTLSFTQEIYLCHDLLYDLGALRVCACWHGADTVQMIMVQVCGDHEFICWFGNDIAASQFCTLAQPWALQRRMNADSLLVDRVFLFIIRRPAIHRWSSNVCELIPLT